MRIKEFGNKKQLNEVAPLLALGAGLARVGTAAIRGIGAVGGALASSSSDQKDDTDYFKLGQDIAKATEDKSQINKQVELAIQEHISKGVPFSECMFRAGSTAFTEFYNRVREMRESLNLDWQDQELLNTDIGECITVEGEVVPLDVPMEDMDPEGPEVTIGDYTTTHFYMCGSAIETAEKHADKPGMEKLIQLQDMIYKLERAVMDAGESSDEAKEFAQKVHIEIMQTARDIGIDDEVAEYQNMHLDSIIKGDPKPGFGRVDEDVNEAEYQGKKVKLNSPKRGGSKKFYVYVKNPKTGRVKKISWGDTTGLSVKAKNRGAVRSFVARHKCKQANDKMTARYWSCRTPRYKALGVKGGQWW